MLIKDQCSLQNVHEVIDFVQSSDLFFTAKIFDNFMVFSESYNMISIPIKKDSDYKWLPVKIELMPHLFIKKSMN